MAGTLEAAVWGAELAQGSGRERIYVVEPTGRTEDAPHVTDKKFPGNRGVSASRIVNQGKPTCSRSLERHTLLLGLAARGILWPTLHDCASQKLVPLRIYPLDQPVARASTSSGWQNKYGRPQTQPLMPKA